MLSSARKAPSIVFSVLLWRRIQAQCYYPDSTSEPRDTVCNASAPVSLCCQNGETCLTNGLCFSEWDTSINTGTCTDKTWASPICFQQCVPTLGIDHGFHTLYRCNYDFWCCSTGGNTTSCCNDAGVEPFLLKSSDAVMGGSGILAGFTIAPVEIQTSTSTAPSSASAASNADTGPTKSYSSVAGSNTTATQEPYPEHNTSVSDAIKTGLGAGLGVGLPLLAGLTLALVFLRRLRRQSNSKRTDIEKKTAGVVVDGESSAHHGRQEMESLPAEVPDSRRDTTQEIDVRA